MQLSDRIGRRMRLHDLHVLMAVVQAGSMNRAAKLLNTTQPAISRSVRELEDAFRVRLLDRGRQGIQLTEYGRALCDAGAAVFDDLRTAVKNIEFLADPTVGDVSVGATESVSTGLLPAVYSRLRDRHPGIAMKVVQMATIEQHFRALRERNVDLIVGRIPQSTEPDIAVEVLYHDRTVVATGPRSKWARRKKIELAELADEPWTTAAPDTLVGSLVANAFRAAGLAFPPKGVAFGPMNLHAALSARGGFIGTFPASALRFASTLPPLKVLPVDLRIPPWPIGIMTLKNRTLSPVVKLFIDRAREVVKPLAKSLPQSPDRG